MPPRVPKESSALSPPDGFRPSGGEADTSLGGLNATTPRQRPYFRWSGTLLVLVAIALAAILAHSASADIVLDSGQGEGAGQISAAQAIAADPDDGTVFVADSGNRRISVFAADGSFIRAFGFGVDTGANELEVCTTASGCQAGLDGDAGGQLAAGTTSIALDDSGGPADGDLYIADTANARVQRFTPEGEFVLAFGDGVNEDSGGDVCTAASGDTCRAATAGSDPGQLRGNSDKLDVDSAGIVHVLSHIDRLQRFDSDGAFIEQLTLPEPAGGWSNNRSAVGLALDSTGNFYAAGVGFAGAVRKYDAAGNELETLNPSLNIQAIATDEVDNLYVADTTGASSNETRILRYDPAGELVKVLYGNGTLQRRPVALAPFSNAEGDIFALETTAFGGPGRLAHVALPPPGPIVISSVADPIGNVRATMTAAVNPEGEQSTVSFEYVDDAAYQSEGLGGPSTVTTPPSDPTPADFEPVNATAEIPCAQAGDPGCLEPESIYHLRAVATNASGTTFGAETTLTTLPPLNFGESFSTQVGADDATLHGELNPLTLPTEARFEYVTEQQFQDSGFDQAAEVPDVGAGADLLDFGAGHERIERSAELDGLEPGSQYRYRLVAENFFGSFDGPTERLTTFPAEIPERSDCPNQQLREGGPDSHLPDCRAYEMVSPLQKGGRDIFSKLDLNNRPLSHYKAAADGEGLSYSATGAFAGAENATYVNQYIATRDAQEGWQSEPITPPKEKNIVAGLGDAGHLNSNQFTAFSDDLSVSWLFTEADPKLHPAAVTGYRNLYKRDNATGSYEPLTKVMPASAPPSGSGYYRPQVEGVSADGSRTVFSANDRLTASASSATNSSGGPIRQLYEHLPNGSVRLVSVLPNGSASGFPCSAAGLVGSSRYLRWDGAVSEDGARIFWTTGGQCGDTSSGAGRIYVRINGQSTVAVSESVSGADATFWSGSSDGSRAVFSIGDLTNAGAKLYSFEVDSETPTLIAENVPGVAGVSEDARRIYFFSKDKLAPEAETETCGAIEGSPEPCNLYLYEQGEGIRFVGSVSGAEAGTRTIPTIGSFRPNDQLTTTSPDGGHLVFASQGSPTGYDNKDAASGMPDREVYLYDATAAGGAGELRCISCNPSRARPVGRLGQEERNYFRSDGPAGWTAATILGRQWALSPQRFLAPDGSRVYFEAHDALVPRDTNGQRDVYMWQAPETGECTSDSASYFELPGGCISLISTGKSTAPSYFVDADPSGDNVFIRTSEQLVGADNDELIDIYVARAGGGFADPPSPPEPCTGDGCQGEPTDPPPAEQPGSGQPGEGNPQLPAEPDCAAAESRAEKAQGRLKRASKKAKNLARKAKKAKGKKAKKRAKQKAKRAKKQVKKAKQKAKRAEKALEQCRAGGQS